MAETSAREEGFLMRT